MDRQIALIDGSTNITQTPQSQQSTHGLESRLDSYTQKNMRLSKKLCVGSERLKNGLKLKKKLSLVVI